MKNIKNNSISFSRVSNFNSPMTVVWERFYKMINTIIQQHTSSNSFNVTIVPSSCPWRWGAVWLQQVKSIFLNIFHQQFPSSRKFFNFVISFTQLFNTCRALSKSVTVKSCVWLGTSFLLKLSYTRKIRQSFRERNTIEFWSTRSIIHLFGARLTSF